MASITAAIACGARTDMGEVVVASGDASTHDAAVEDSGPDTAIIVLYGPAPQDGGVRDVAMRGDGNVPIYGAPPPPESD